MIYYLLLLLLIVYLIFLIYYNNYNDINNTILVNNSIKPYADDTILLLKNKINNVHKFKIIETKKTKDNLLDQNYKNLSKIEGTEVISDNIMNLKLENFSDYSPSFNENNLKIKFKNNIDNVKPNQNQNLNKSNFDSELTTEWNEITSKNALTHYYQYMDNLPRSKIIIK